LKSFFLFFWRKINSKNRKIIRDFCKDIWLDVIGANLSQMATIYGSDKAELHGYTEVYERYFQNIKNKSIEILEIGIGGGDNNESGGGSLRLWKRYFPKAQIVGIDIFDKTFFEEKRIKTYIGNQSDTYFLTELTTNHCFEIVIDDGSHMSKDVITSFLHLFPLMPSKSLYIIEDVHTCFYDSDEKYQGMSSIEFFKSIIENIPFSSQNLVEMNKIRMLPPIDFIHFYSKLIIIQKK
jgi:hypothetical protein